ncbi:hypothetical protein [uncultured Methanobrevibacter sp.]|uniref:hypothetical protein n=1 Tax=uncultured Methanobrevibacter sp. TaxID=253161 RepID=UPI0025CCB4ED|nr:hypothetical protein [uncultured Methanobrevibacter sp.]
MKDLIAALQFLLGFLKNPDEKYSTNCEHDVLYVCDVDFSKMTLEQVKTLINTHGFYPGLGDEYDYIRQVVGEDFNWGEITDEQWRKIKEENCIGCYAHSYRFGSC